SQQPRIEAQLQGVVGRTYFSLGMMDEADPHLSRALELRTRNFGEQHEDTISAMNEFAWLRLRRDRYDECAAPSDRAISLAGAALGERSLTTLSALGERGVLLHERGRHAEAAETHKRVLEIRQQMLGPEHIQTLRSMKNLADSYQGLGRFEDARTLY